MATYKALSTVTVGAGGASTISFTSIPATYTDLIVKVSGRSTATGSVYDDLGIYFNSSTSDWTWRIGYGLGSSASQTSGSTRYFAFATSNSATSNTFSNVEYYIPNYTSSTTKSVMVDSVTENNGTTALVNIGTGLWSSTNIISSITLNCANGNFAQYSTATLYGVFKGPETLPSTPTIGTATAGVESASVTFTPTSATNVDASYTALSSPGSITATGTSSPITVSGLTADTSYTFQVRANNPGGSSAYSSASNSVTPTGIDYDSIATVSVGAGGVSSVTFSGIPATYKHLQIRCITFDGGNVIRFNGDTGNNYNRHYLFGNGSSVTSGGNTSQTGMSIIDYTTIANVFAPSIVDIGDYASTNKFKTVMSLTGFANAGGKELLLFSGSWQNTNAITSITITNGSIGQYSHFALYGIRG